MQRTRHAPKRRGPVHLSINRSQSTTTAHPDFNSIPLQGEEVAALTRNTDPGRQRLPTVAQEPDACLTIAPGFHHSDPQVIAIDRIDRMIDPGSRSARFQKVNHSALGRCASKQRYTGAQIGDLAAHFRTANCESARLPSTGWPQVTTTE